MSIQKLQAELRKARRQLALLYEMGNLMRATLKLDEIIYLILSAVTSHEGLSFNRAMLFLTDERRVELRGAAGVGPLRAEDSNRIWASINQKKLLLDGFIDVYRKSNGKIDVTLNRMIRSIRIPLNNENQTVLTRVLLKGMPVKAITQERRSTLKDPILKKFNIEEFAAVPIKGKDRVIGVLVVDNITTRKPITNEDVFNLSRFADHAGLAIENALVFSRILETSQKDQLTGLWNHSHFFELLARSIQVAKLQNHPLSVVIFDVDNFKQLNDMLGHLEGDRALQVIAKITRKTLRRNDYIARYGGEEFAIIFPGLTKLEARSLVEKLRVQIKSRTRSLYSNGLGPITISIGIASYPMDATEPEKLIFCADAALYEAKRQGKDRTNIYRRSDS